MKEIKKIIIATGGTGGHVFPALSLSSCLKKNFEVKLISDQRGMRSVSYTHLTLPTNREV